VHILSADLTTRKRTMQPLKPMIWGLRKFDLERTAACMGAGHEGPAILSSLDQFATIADNLIDLTFNVGVRPEPIIAKADMSLDQRA
jgi:hypothetical protein